MKTREDYDDASRQIEELVFHDSVDTLVDFLTEKQVQQLAEDWRAGKEERDKEEE
jgi:hypothetical protein